MAHEASEIKAADANHRIARLRRPERPSWDDLNKTISKINDEIGGLRNRIEEINAIVDGRSKGQSALSFEILDSKKRLTDFRLQYAILLQEKKALTEELSMIDEAGEKMKKEAKMLRDELPYVRVEEIDEDIKRIQDRIKQTTLTPQEEQRLAKQVSNLQKSRDFVSKYTAKSDRLSSDESHRTEILKEIGKKDETLSHIKKLKDEEAKKTELLQEKANHQVVDIPTLVAERSTLLDKMKMLREQVTQLRSDFKLKEQDYWVKEKEWRQQAAMERKQRFEKREAEWKEREEVRRQKAIENYVPPYTDEIILCDQLSAFLQKFVPTLKEPVSASKTSEVVSHKGFEGLQQINKNQTDDDLEGWFSGFGSKAKSKKSRGSTSGRGKDKEKISLTLDALSSFAKVSVKPPLTIGDALGALNELKSKKEHFLKLQSQSTNSEKNGSDVCVVAAAEVTTEIAEEGIPKKCENSTDVSISENGRPKENASLIFPTQTDST